MFKADRAMKHLQALTKMPKRIDVNQLLDVLILIATVTEKLHEDAAREVAPATAAGASAPPAADEAEAE
eukprot:3278134-Amphidinium_carterae.1